MGGIKMPSMDSNASKAFAAAAAVGAGVAAVYCVKKCFATGKNPLSNFEFVEPQPFETVTKERRKEVLKNPFEIEKIPREVDVIVIGAGISGLTTANFLARTGKKVVVLEQHSVVGGCCHTFNDKGYEFDTGIHYVGSVTEKNLFRTLLDVVTDCNLQWVPMADAYDTVVLGTAKEGSLEQLRQYPMLSGKDRVKMSLKQQFPNDEAVIDKYFDDMLRWHKLGLYEMILKNVPGWIAGILPFFSKGCRDFFKYSKITLQEYLDSLTPNEELKAVLSYCFGDYGMPPWEGSCVTHSMLVAHFIYGAYYPLGGPQYIQFTAVPALQKLGAVVLTKAPVKRILFEHGKAVGVMMDKENMPKYKSLAGEITIRAKTIVSTAGVMTTYQKLVPQTELDRTDIPQSIKRDVRPGPGHIYGFVGFKGDQSELKLPAGNYWVFPSEDLKQMYRGFYDRPNVDNMFMFISFPSAKDPDYNKRHPGKSTALVITEAPYGWFKQFENEPFHKRSEAYEKLKKELGETLMRSFRGLFPELAHKIDYIDFGTPLSNNYYYGRVDGSSYGLNMDISRIQARWLNPRTPFPNLYLSGQDVVMPGFAGAMFAGALTAGIVINRNAFNDLVSLHKKRLALLKSKEKK